MGRPKRITLGGYFYHVLNRANGRLRIFKKDTDFAAFDGPRIHLKKKRTAEKNAHLITNERLGTD